MHSGNHLSTAAEAAIVLYRIYSKIVQINCLHFLTSKNPIVAQ